MPPEPKADPFGGRRTGAGGDKVLSVSQLTRMLQTTLRQRFFDVWVGGEISNLSRPHSGHLYLTLADDDAQLRAVIWRNTAVELDFELDDGLDVICRGEIDIYPPRGTYQLIITHIEPLGLGALQLAFRKLHAKLDAEGLFDPARKRPLPKIPQRVAVVTSPSGAALHDFLQVTSRRWPNLQMLLVPCRVQGEGAAGEIARGIQLANRLAPAPDVLVVTRGGGSMEDLWAFNEETVVRAVSGSRIPTVSAVGHEIDITLCDLAADVRALTPSEAGELVVPIKSELTSKLNDIQYRLTASLVSLAAQARQGLNALASRRVFRHPQDLVQLLSRRVDELEIRLFRAGDRCLERSQHQAANLADRLDAVSPLNVLARGYSVTQTESGQPITDAQTVQPGQRIVTRLAQGHIESVIERTQSPE